MNPHLQKLKKKEWPFKLEKHWKNCEKIEKCELWTLETKETQKNTWPNESDVKKELQKTDWHLRGGGGGGGKEGN